MKPILFTLEKCPKCETTKEYLKDIDYTIYPLPHEFKDWKDFDIEITKKYGVFEDLQKTAPILVVMNKIMGQLRIKKWVQDNEGKM